jgi:hypothetical protein
MRLVLDLDGTQVEFVQPGVDGEYPWLTKVGTLLLAARAGHLEGIGTGEAANVTVELDNTGRQASELIGYRPRTRGWIYDDAGAIFFVGLIQSIQYGWALVLTLEA